jgi:hypothetical protein
MNYATARAIADSGVCCMSEVGQSRRFNLMPSLPVVPHQRTFAGSAGTSQRCQHRKSHPRKSRKEKDRPKAVSQFVIVQLIRRDEAPGPFCFRR